MPDRARSFGNAAPAYARHRPGYPSAAITWALAPVAALRPLRVLDLAAGTGALTASLVGLASDARAGMRVLAVEPDPQMLAELRRHLPGVPAVSGVAEALGVAGGSADAVLVGQALHWFDPALAMPEIARVLAPGGVLAALWNLDDDRVDWVAGLHEVVGGTASYLRRVHTAPIRHPAFEPVRLAEFGHAQRRDADSLVATIGTHSALLRLSAAEQAELLARVRGYLASRPETSSGPFDLPIVTLVARAHRAEPGHRENGGGPAAG